MSSYNKAKGTRWETDLEDYLNEAGLHARRLPRAGAKDIGDLSITVGDFVVVVEAKNVKAANMADFLRQADVESDNYEEKYGVPTVPVVAVKARQKQTGEGRLTMTLESFVDLLRLVGALR